MKKTLNILKLFCSILVISVSVTFLKKLYEVMHFAIYGGVKPTLFKQVIPDSWNENYYYIIAGISTILMFYPLYLAVAFRKVIFSFSRDKVFTKENSERLRKIGKGLIIYGVVILFFDLVLKHIIEGNFDANSFNPSYSLGYSIGYTLGNVIGQRLPLFLIALFIQFISFIVVKGNELQEENDLTI